MVVKGVIVNTFVLLWAPFKSLSVYAVIMHTYKIPTISLHYNKNDPSGCYKCHTMLCGTMHGEYHDVLPCPSGLVYMVGMTGSKV